MRNNIDILLGILTWIMAASVPVLWKSSDFSFSIKTVCLFSIPPLWIVCFCLVFFFRKRPARRLWWVWLSVPVALYAWLAGGFVFGALGHRRLCSIRRSFMRNPAEIQQHIETLVMAGQLAQNARFKEEWEPRVTKELAGTADLCLQKLLAAVAEYESEPWTKRNPAALKSRLLKSWAKIVAQRSETAKAVLREMVCQEAAASAEILTLNGLAAPLPELARLHPDPDYWTRRLAAGEVLDRAMAKSFFGFAGRVFAELDQAWLWEKPWGETIKILETVAQNWRSQLKTIARTVLHAVANRTKNAVGDVLG